MLKLIQYYLSARFGVSSLKFVVSGNRVLLNVFAVLFAFGALIAFAQLELDWGVVDAIPAGFLFLVSAALFIYSDKVPLNDLRKNSRLTSAREKILSGMLDYSEQASVDDYNKLDVDNCGAHLNKFMSHLSRNGTDADLAMRYVKKLVISLNSLNEKTGMIETGEKERICDFIDSCLLAIDVEFDHDVTEQWREW